MTDFAFSADLVVTTTDDEGMERGMYRERGERTSPTITVSNYDLGVAHGEMPPKVFVLVDDEELVPTQKTFVPPWRGDEVLTSSIETEDRNPAHDPKKVEQS